MVVLNQVHLHFAIVPLFLPFRQLCCERLLTEEGARVNLIFQDIPDAALPDGSPVFPLEISFIQHSGNRAASHAIQIAPEDQAHCFRFRCVDGKLPRFIVIIAQGSALPERPGFKPAPDAPSQV